MLLSLRAEPRDRWLLWDFEKWLERLAECEEEPAVWFFEAIEIEPARGP
jgi:hypothetical protein